MKRLLEFLKNVDSAEKPWHLNLRSRGDEITFTADILDSKTYLLDLVPKK